MMKKLIPHAVAATLLLGASAGASAADIVATFDSMTPASQVTLTGGGLSNPVSGPAGRLNFSRTGGTYAATPLPGVDGSFWAFCVEIDEPVNVGGTQYEFSVGTLENADNGIGTTRADQILELLGAVLPDFSKPLTETQYVALQLAIWEITRETGALNVNDGFLSFTGDAAALALANEYLANVDGQGPRATGIAALLHTGAQDLLVQFPVPEPGTLGLALIGLGGLFGMRRKQKA